MAVGDDKLTQSLDLELYRNNLKKWVLAASTGWLILRSLIVAFVFKWSWVMGASLCVFLPISCRADNPTLLVPEVSFEVTRFLIDEDEIKIVDKLIASTHEQLNKQQQLKELMVQFQRQKEEFVQGNQTRTHTTRLVRIARQIYEMIMTNHFEHLFSKDYLDELQFFSSIAGKTTLSKP